MRRSGYYQSILEPCRFRANLSGALDSETEELEVSS